MQSSYARERGSLATVRDAVGEYLVPNPAFKTRHVSAHARDWVAPLGGSNVRVIGDLLGRSANEIQQLYQEGVLHQGEQWARERGWCADCIFCNRYRLCSQWLNQTDGGQGTDRWGR